MRSELYYHHANPTKVAFEPTLIGCGNAKLVKFGRKLEGNKAHNSTVAIDCSKEVEAGDFTCIKRSQVSNCKSIATLIVITARWNDDAT